MAKDNNGFTQKDMFNMILDKLDKNDEKRVVENKRIYDKFDQAIASIKEHNSSQDTKIQKNCDKIQENKTNINRFWAGIGGFTILVVGAIVTAFQKLFNK